MNDKIFQAIRLGENIVFEKLLSTTDINTLNESKQNLLQHAISYKNTKASTLLIDKAINLNHQDDRGYSALHYCSLYKDVDTCNKILRNINVLVNIKDAHGNSPLWTAVLNSKETYDIVNLLVRHGGNPYSVNNVGKSPFDFAKQINDLNLMKVLDPNSE